MYNIAGDMTEGKSVQFTVAARHVCEVPKEALTRPGPGAYLVTKPFVPPPMPIDPHADDS